jgi:hypothetical protein
MREDLSHHLFGVSHRVQQTNGRSRRTWSITAFDGTDRLFRLACGCEDEWGERALAELERLRGAAGLEIERDVHFQPCRLSKVRWRGTSNEPGGSTNRTRPPHMGSREGAWSLIEPP